MKTTTKHSCIFRFPGAIGLAVLAVVAGACGDKATSDGRSDSTSASPVAGSQVEANTALASRLMESFNTGDTATMRALTAPDYVEHNPAPGQAQGVDGLIKSCMDIRVGFPDIKVSVEDVVVSGDMIAIRSRMTGTFTNAFAGMKPNGKKMDVEAIDLMRIKDGKQVEHWGLFDIMAMMTQLEMMPNADDASSSAATAPSGDQQTASDSGK